MGDPLKEAKQAVKRHMKALREAVTAKEWDRAATESIELSERLSDVAALEFGA